MRDWSHAEHVQAAGVEIVRMADVLRDGDMSTPVRTCPGWNLAELTAHTGGLHRWVAAMVRDLSERRYDRDGMDMGLPADPSGYPTWLEEGAKVLSEALLSHDPQAPVSWWARDGQVRFWSRRQLHETVVHRVDAELALGVPVLIDEDVAADGVEEFLDVLPYVRWNPGVAQARGAGGDDLPAGRHRRRVGDHRRSRSFSLPEIPPGGNGDRPHRHLVRPDAGGVGAAQRRRLRRRGGHRAVRLVEGAQRDLTLRPGSGPDVRSRTPMLQPGPGRSGQGLGSVPGAGPWSGVRGGARGIFHGRSRPDVQNMTGHVGDSRHGCRSVMR